MRTGEAGETDTQSRDTFQFSPSRLNKLYNGFHLQYNPMWRSGPESTWVDLTLVDLRRLRVVLQVHRNVLQLHRNCRERFIIYFFSGAVRSNRNRRIVSVNKGVTHKQADVMGKWEVACAVTIGTLVKNAFSKGLFGHLRMYRFSPQGRHCDSTLNWLSSLLSAYASIVLKACREKRLFLSCHVFRMKLILYPGSIDSGVGVVFRS